MSLHSVSDVAEHLSVTADDVINAAGLTLGELEHAAEQHGFCVTCYRLVPVLSDREVQIITARLS
ncbi:hypothetical protein [Rhodococcus sp. JS3073]|uniref:hypothetical protein n=1 Tax=Rhodococcus sp. JS3073 TaxID=3002901 RepID=UPI00228697BE|nr:hypothetical protein [Rhodococcus sp. JS3073]WAM13947.1 hypothetical protein OYT95_31675 [Rhodococcus sp. JS3073]